MAGIFGFEFLSKKEREQRYQEYVKKIFPYGDLQKQKIQDILNELIGIKNGNQLMIHYILIKEGLIDSETKDYNAIAARVEKKKFVKLTQEIKSCIRLLMDKDMAIDENLDYPTAGELKAEAAKK